MEKYRKKLEDEMPEESMKDLGIDFQLSAKSSSEDSSHPSQYKNPMTGSHVMSQI